MNTVRTIVMLAAAVLAQTALAQGTAISLGGLQHDTTLPVEVTADNLSVANEAGQAVFEGNVLVIQGPMRLAAQTLEVLYAQAEGTGTTEISEMLAKGGVTFVNGADAAEAQSAVYSPEAGTLVMVGDVLLTQGAAAISGERLTVDLATGTGTMEGRVRTTFQSGDN
ncbi:MAG: LptA/OstA family protein [Pseudomonadota bacterium]